MIGQSGRSLWALALGVALLSACAGPLSPAAPPKVYRIGWLSGGTQASATLQIETMRQALRDLGYVEGRYLSLEIRHAEGFPERDPALAAELIALKCDVILVRGIPEALALKRVTTTIPIVLAGVPDPVENGLVASLARPGGNITGGGQRWHVHSSEAAAAAEGGGPGGIACRVPVRPVQSGERARI